MTEKADGRAEEELRAALEEATMAGAINLQMEDPSRKPEVQERATVALLKLAELVANTPDDTIRQVLSMKAKPDGSISLGNGQSNTDRELPETAEAAL